MISSFKFAMCGGLAVIALAGSANAAAFTVTTTADSGPGSLRQAITDANATTTVDRIQFAIPVAQQVGGVWTIAPASPLPDMPAPVLFVGPGSQKLILKGAGLTVSQPVVASNPVGSPQFTISGLTIRDGKGISSIGTRLRLEDVRLVNNVNDARGGGVSSVFTILTVNKCVFDSNPAVTGGGLYVWAGGEAAITNSDFINNGGDSDDILCAGGAIRCEAKMTATNCRFIGNRAHSGTAIEVESYGEPFTNNTLPGEASISNCLFEDNFQNGPLDAAYNWGGTVTATFANITIQQSTFLNNSVGRGGAVYAAGRNPGGNVKLEGCLLQDNSGLAGSAVFNEGGLVTLVNTTVANNQTESGGAIQDRKYGSQTPITTLVNSTFSHNGQAGGASEIYAAAGSIRLLNTLIRPVAGGVSLTKGTGSFISQGNNLSEDNGGGFLKAAGDKINTPAELDNALRNNGGPTRTFALLSGSPAIDAGNDSVLGSPYKLTSDQRSGFPRKSGSHVDIGAYESQIVPAFKGAPSSSAGLF